MFLGLNIRILCNVSAHIEPVYMDHIRSSSRIGGFLRRKSYCVPQASNKDMFGLGLDSRDPLMKRIVTQPLEFQTTGPQTSTFTITSIFAHVFLGTMPFLSQDCRRISREPSWIGLHGKPKSWNTGAKRENHRCWSVVCARWRDLANTEPWILFELHKKNNGG